MYNSLQDRIFQVNEKKFDALCLEIFQKQAQEITVYRNYLNHLGVVPSSVNHPDHIPFLPVEFFKTHRVLADSSNYEAIFESSSTTGKGTSKHFVKDLSIYEKSFRLTFSQSFGPPHDYCFLGLLPSYLERRNSSLVYMVNDLVKTSRYAQSAFYLYEHEKLHAALIENAKADIPTILFGVSFALLDFAEKYQLNLPNTKIIETGGMKGRKQEPVKAEVYEQLTNAFPQSQIHSEYGMTELLSQAYSGRDGIYHCPPWMRAVTVCADDPLSLETPGKTGILNIIDLANVNGCSFIATSDLGKTYADGSFEILGRADHSDIRGCSLLVV